MPAGNELHLRIDAKFQNKLYFSPVAEENITTESAGFTVHLDPYSATRANGVVIDAVDSPDGPAFRIDNPNGGGQVKQMPVAELKRRIDAGGAGELFDVRTPEERAKASIPGARLMTPEETERIGSLPKDTPLTFHCHSGVRSQAAAEHFAAMGFGEVYNVAGGIDAWSTEIDPSVPRY
jgi:monothiol glutaredoxin